MEKFMVSSLGANCIIDSDRNLRKFFEINKTKLSFPNIQISDYCEQVKYHLIYRDSTYEGKKIICDDYQIQFNYPTNCLTDSNIAYVSRYLIEKQYAINNMCTCHSACVEKDGKAILLLGGAGAGKTSIALNLCLKYGFNIISNDQTVIGLKDSKIIALGGTKFLNLRKCSIVDNVPSLQYLFGNNRESWSDKIIVQSSDLGIQEQFGTIEIGEIYILHLDNREKNIIIKKGDSWGNNFNLYQNLSENIRNSISTIVDKYGHPIGYVPSYDTKELFCMRVNLINAINNNTHYEYLSGNLQDIIDYILNNRLNENYKILKKAE